MKATMFTRTMPRFLRACLLALALGASSQALADVMLQVTLDTAKFNAGNPGGTTPGFLDFQFANGGFGPAPLATVAMRNLQGFDMAGFAPDNVSPVPGGFLFDNTQWNSLLYTAEFGNVFSFVLTFAGEASADVWSSFVITAFDSAWNPLFTGDALVDLTWTKLGTSNGVVPAAVDAAVATVAEAAAVPEPGALALAALGLLMLVLVRRRA